MDIFWPATAAFSLIMATGLMVELIHIVWSSKLKTADIGNDRSLYAYSIAGHSCSSLLLRVLALFFMLGLAIFSLLHMLGG